jgi:RIO kinase 1
LSTSSEPVDWDALRYQALNEDLGENQRWSTWADVDRTQARGPQPWPDWLVTSQAAIDTDLGVLKTGKEADVFLLERAVPGGESCLLAAKRYRTTDHRLFTRDGGYTDGRRVRRSRDNRAIAAKTDYGRQLGALQWANTEFVTLKALYAEGVPVPYPVQIQGREILMEFIADATDSSWTAAPRLVQTDPAADELQHLWEQVVTAMCQLARLQVVHGDLSPYNVLVRSDATGPQLVIIDVPQVVDLVANPNAVDFLHRDCRTMADWFARKGLQVDADALLAEVLGHAW